jgi:Zn-finger nucleic acid-binding protein
MQMLCPIDGQPLVMTDRSGVEIDYCPKCRGVWLDRGELDKIIDRATPASAPAPQPQTGAAPFTMAQPQGQRYRDDDDDSYKKKRKGSLLGELFDF